MKNSIPGRRAFRPAPAILLNPRNRNATVHFCTNCDTVFKAYALDVLVLKIARGPDITVAGDNGPYAGAKTEFSPGSAVRDWPPCAHIVRRHLGGHTGVCLRRAAEIWRPLRGYARTLPHPSARHLTPIVPGPSDNPPPGPIESPPPGPMDRPPPGPMDRPPPGPMDRPPPGPIDCPPPGPMDRPPPGPMDRPPPGPIDWPPPGPMDRPPPGPIEQGPPGAIEPTQDAEASPAQPMDAMSNATKALFRLTLPTHFSGKCRCYEPTLMMETGNR